MNLLIPKDAHWITNIPESYQSATLKSLKTRYVTYTSYDENNEYTGFSIELRWINCEKGLAQFEKGKEGHCTTFFYMDADDDPIVVFDDDEPGVEHHIFEKVSYEINPDIKPGKLYSFQSSTCYGHFLAIVQSVSKTKISYTEMVPMVSVDDVPEKYIVTSSFVTLDTSTAIPETLEKFSDYTVTELYDIDDWGIRIKERGGRIHIKDFQDEVIGRLGGL